MSIRTETIAEEGIYSVVIHEGPGVVRIAGGGKWMLNENEAMIGPSEVKVGHRGREIYPTVLRQIVSKYNITYVVTRNNNLSAQRAFEKAGMKRIAKYQSLNVFGFHIITTRDKIASHI